MRVSVSRPGVFVNHTHTDLFLKNDCITATGLNIGAYRLMFAVFSDTQVGVTANGLGNPIGRS